MSSRPEVSEEIISRAMDLWSSHIRDVDWFGITDDTRGVEDTLVEELGLSREDAIKVSSIAFSGLREASAKRKVGGNHV